jgi:hypothetical protein
LKISSLEIDEMVDKLIEKRNDIEVELRSCKDCEKDELKKKLSAINKLIQKALKNLY